MVLKSIKLEVPGMLINFNYKKFKIDSTGFPNTSQNIHTYVLSPHK